MGKSRGILYLKNEFRDGRASTRLSSVVRLEMDGGIVFTARVSLECLGTPILKLVFLTTQAVMF